MRVLMTSMSRRRCGRAGPRFLRGWRSDLDGTLADLDGRGVLPFLVVFSAVSLDGAVGSTVVGSGEAAVHDSVRDMSLEQKWFSGLPGLTPVYLNTFFSLFW